MIRTILEYFVQNLLDRRAPLPGWLRWFVNRDTALREFERQAFKLDERLRVSAQVRREQLAGDFIPVALVTLASREAIASAPLKTYVRLGWLAAVAATILGIAAFMQHTTEKRTNAAHAELLSTQLASMPNDMLSIFTEAATKPQQYSPLAQLSLPRVDVLRDLPRNAQGRLKKSLDEFNSQWTALGQQVRERFESAVRLN